MPAHIVLLRGVNVGGHNTLKMAAFRDALTAAGFDDVKTYIQSGNAVLRAEGTAGDVAVRVSQILQGQFDIDVPVFVLSHQSLVKIVQATPFEGDPSRVMLYFCFDHLDQDFDLEPLEALKLPEDQLAWGGDVIYFHAPEGIGRSKLAAKIDRLVPTQLTARNLRTAQKMVELAALS